MHGGGRPRWRRGSHGSLLTASVFYMASVSPAPWPKLDCHIQDAPAVALAIEEKGAWSRSAYQLSRRRQCVAQLREGGSHMVSFEDHVAYAEPPMRPVLLEI